MPLDKPKKSDKESEGKSKKTTTTSKPTKPTQPIKPTKPTKTDKTTKTKDATKNKKQKTESKRGGPHKKLDENEMEAGQIVINKYISSKYWSLYLDIYLLFSVTISYGIVLYLTDNLTGIVFIIFAIICCFFTSAYTYQDVKQDISSVLKDLEIMLKGG
jgi:hypothetical protein